MAVGEQQNSFWFALRGEIDKRDSGEIERENVFLRAMAARK